MFVFLFDRLFICTRALDPQRGNDGSTRCSVWTVTVADNWTASKGPARMQEKTSLRKKT